MPSINQSVALCPRRVVLIDIENVNGGALNCEEESRNAFERLSGVLGDLRSSDTAVIVAAGSKTAPSIFNWAPFARIRIRAGLDGADRELLEILTSESLGSRFDEIVLVSGDGIFADALSRVAGGRAATVVVAEDRRLSRRLRLAANHCRILPVMVDRLAA